MSNQHQFGGNWTSKKLENIQKYLIQYTTIFKSNPKARYFKTIYIDAFAGTGYRKPSGEDTDSIFLPIFSDEEVQSFYEGSVKLALNITPKFDKYIFIEQDPDRYGELKKIKNEYSTFSKDIFIKNEDANKYLIRICEKVDWKKFRAVIFLDPYGMQVDWDTIQKIAETKAIDMWLLFPLGVAINRLLKKNGKLSVSITNRLNKIFGSEDWKEVFYKEEEIESLFGKENQIMKVGNFAKISDYFVSRLKTIFAGVAENPLPLYNSKNNPLYLLCFAATNEKGAKTAIKIANYILDN
ncbi:MAG: three-Cys-motif partner protein TcmP [Ignavibacteriaceae bacterium]